MREDTQSSLSYLVKRSGGPFGILLFVCQNADNNNITSLLQVIGEVLLILPSQLRYKMTRTSDQLLYLP